MKLKSANINKNSSDYIFWYEASDNTEILLKKFSELSDENLNISIYSKTGAFE